MKALMPYLAAGLASPWLSQSREQWADLKQHLLRQPATVEVYLAIDDPYSYLLAQVLPRLQARFAVKWRIYTVLNREAEHYPAPAQWYPNACHDAEHLARLYQLSWPQDLPSWSTARRAGYTRDLLLAEQQADSVAHVAELFRRAWQGAAATRVWQLADWQASLAANEARRKRHKHYASAMLYYAGQWYWGLDRLDHLEHRLLREGRALCQTAPQFERTWRDFCTLPAPEQAPEDTELEVFFSIRSPYSHLGLLRAVQLAEHYHLPLKVRPVLPMLMRGLPVPPSKKWYIFHDTKREARKLGIAYGKVADPLGAGVEACYQLYAWAEAQGKGLAYLLSVSHGVNSQGLHADQPRDLKKMVERAGLNWAEALPLLGNNDWRSWAQDNLNALNDAGLWGVPSFRYGDLRFWGQDRLGILEQALRKRWRLAGNPHVTE